MLFVKWFWERNKFVTIVFIFSFVLVLSYAISLDLDLFNIKHYVSILSFIEQLLIAYLGAFIFYVIQTAYSDYKSWKTYSKILIPKIEKISDLIKAHVNILAQRYLQEEFSVSHLNEKDFIQIIDKLNLEDKLPTFDESGNQQDVLVELIIHKTLIKAEIYDIYRVLGSNLEEKTQELINKIAESDYFKDLEFLEYNKLGNQYVTSKEAFTEDSGIQSVGVFKIKNIDYKNFYNYYLLIQELNQYIEAYRKN